MRISVDKDDRGYSGYAYRARVFLDGVEIKNCMTADEEQGEAICYVEGPDGLWVKDETRERFKTETRRGRVRISFADGHSPPGEA